MPFASTVTWTSLYCDLPSLARTAAATSCAFAAGAPWKRVRRAANSTAANIRTLREAIVLVIRGILHFDDLCACQGQPHTVSVDGGRGSCLRSFRHKKQRLGCGGWPSFLKDCRCLQT